MLPIEMFLSSGPSIGLCKYYPLSLICYNVDITFTISRDRCRTTNNMLGDAYGAAVVEALSKNELKAMDEAKEKERQAEEDMDLESAHAMIEKQWKNIKKVCLIYVKFF